ncbi:hypothetical protein OG542_16755 [Streptomyces violaceus]|uniref:hypothetical protein n=1 Tax=Streptomyces violaceus TaxID=1936 RepID=UPI002E1A279B
MITPAPTYPAASPGSEAAAQPSERGLLLFQFIRVSGHTQTRKTNGITAPTLAAKAYAPPGHAGAKSLQRKSLQRSRPQ